jgi:hypothetical protein
MKTKLSLSIPEVYLDLGPASGHDATIAVTTEDVRLWCLECDACSTGYVFDSAKRTVWAPDGKTVEAMPHLDEVFAGAVEQQAANRRNPIGAHLQPFVAALEVAVAARDGSSVYFAQAEDRVKIGWSRKVATRIAGLQTGNASPIRLLGTIPGSRAAEKRLHERFAHLRLHGEWFRAEPELMTFVALEVR